MSRCLDERRIECPFCGEHISVLVDFSAGPQRYIEDCSVCCRPIQFTLSIDSAELETLQVDCAD